MKILYWTASCCQKVLYKVSIVTQCLLSKPLLMSFKLEDISLQVDSTTKNYFCLRSASPFIINCAACAGINGQRCSNIISTKEVYFFPSHYIRRLFTPEEWDIKAVTGFRNAPYMPNRKTKITVLKLILYPSTAMNNLTTAIKYNSVDLFT